MANSKTLLFSDVCPGEPCEADKSSGCTCYVHFTQFSRSPAQGNVDVEAPPAFIPSKTFKMVYASLFPTSSLFRVMARERFTNFTIKIGILLIAPREMTFVEHLLTDAL